MGSTPRWADSFRSDLRAGFRLDMSRLLHTHHCETVGDLGARIDALAKRSEGPDPENWVLVKALMASAGAVVGNQEAETYLAFRKDWLARRGMSENCVVISVPGSSVASVDPDLPRATSLLVDRDRRRPEEGRVYLLVVDDRLLVRRAVWRGGKWMMATDDLEHGRAAWREDAEVIGEVRFVSHAMQDDVEIDLLGG